MTSVALHPARPLTPPDRPPDSPPSESSGTGSSEPISEQITRLFPKCRPRATTDVNLNPSPGHQHQVNQANQASNQHSNNTVVGAANKLDPDERRRTRERERDNTANDTSTAIVGRDTATDRIIELAGGRELFSQSRAKAARRSRHSAAVAAVEERDRRRRSPSRNQTNNAPPPTTQQSAQQPPHRAQRRNNEDFLRIQSSRHHHRASNSQTGGRPTPSSPTGPRPTSPPSPQTLNSHIISNTLTPTNIISTNLTSINLTSTNLTAPLPTINLTSTNITASPPVSPPRSLAVVADGEVVVFDDIGDTWKGLRMNLEEASSVQNQNYLSDLEKEGIAHPMSTSASTTPTAYHHNGITYNVNNMGVNEDDLEITAQNHLPESRVAPRVIGSLPIAEYEGSPRRYGVTRQCDNRTQDQILQNIPHTQSLLGQQQPPVSTTASLFPPRPGFPQRILSTKIEDGGNTNSDSLNILSSELSPAVNSTFDYLYEFSETRKVLEEFFKCPREDENKLDLDFNDLDYELHRQTDSSSSYVGQRLAKSPSNQEEIVVNDSPRKSNNSQRERDEYEHTNNFLELSVGTGSSEEFGETEVGLQVGNSRNFTLSPETTDCDSNCGDLDSEMSLMMMENEFGHSGGLRGSSGDLGAVAADMTAAAAARLYTAMPVLEDGLSSGHASDTDNNNPTVMLMRRQISEIEREIVQRTQDLVNERERRLDISNDVEEDDLDDEDDDVDDDEDDEDLEDEDLEDETAVKRSIGSLETSTKITLDPLNGAQVTPPPPAPAPHRQQQLMSPTEHSTESTLKDIRTALQRKTLPLKPTTPEAHSPEKNTNSPVWIPRRQRGNSGESGDSCGHPGKVLSGDEAGDEEEADTDLETDRLLGQQRTDDQGFYDDKDKEGKKKSRNKEGIRHKPSVLIEGVLFRARYLGSTQLVCEGQPTKSTRMMQAEEAVSRIKAPEGENQPSTEVDLFISTEKIMVLNTDLKEIMMDHALRTISYIADIGDLVVLMARRRFVPHEMEDPPKMNRTPKMICHVFESEEAQFIAQSIGQAFQVAYMEFLKANGIEDHSFVKEMDYQEVLNSQEIFGDELQMFAKKEMQKEVVVPKAKGEILGVVIVESGWGSMLPTVVIANLAPAGAAARCGQLNIGDQIIAINGVSLVGLPLSTCQNYIKNSKNQTVVKLTVVPCAPVVEVKIKRPDTKYQLGFSVQNGVICSLLRGGIAERGGVRVGHRIIEINNQSVVAVPHEKIVNLLATSVGEILMKTMPTSMFRLLTGQENPVYI